MTTKHLRKLTFLFTASSLSVACLFAFAAEFNPISQSEINVLAGEWAGTMTYMEYGVDTTRVTVEARMTAVATDSSLERRITILEADGKEVVNTDRIVVAESGAKRVRMGDMAWMVTAHATTQNGTTIAFQAHSEDEGKPGQITNVYFISAPDPAKQDSFVMSKQVLYDYGGREVLRNQFRLGRVNK